MYTRIFKTLPLGILAFAFPAIVSAQIRNPLAFGTLPEFLVALLDIVILIMVPVIVVMLVYSGFLFVTAGGNVEKIKKAKTGILWTMIGAIIILGAQALSIGIEGTVDSLR